MLGVNEIFHSIQGEGVYAGVPTTFVRLQGCNLFPDKCCSYCDTKYAQGSYPDEGKLMDEKFIVAELVHLEPRTYHHWICITGGEPLLQDDELLSLVKLLNRGGWYVEIETNGTLPKPKWWTLVDSWVPDVKCPSSGVQTSSKLIDDWFETRPQDQIKFVVSNQDDLEFAEKVIRAHATANPQVCLSPVILGELSLATLGQPRLEATVELCKELNVRFSLQIHKIIWGNKKGV